MRAIHGVVGGRIHALYQNSLNQEELEIWRSEGRGIPEVTCSDSAAQSLNAGSVSWWQKFNFSGVSAGTRHSEAATLSRLHQGNEDSGEISRN